MVSGCMSPQSHLEKADAAASDIITEYQEKTLSRTEAFTIDKSADSLRRRLMISQELPGHVANGKPNEVFKTQGLFRITLKDAMQIAARNSRSYQAEKEKVFSAALDLDTTRSEYRNSYSALLSSLFNNEDKGDNAEEKTEQKGDAGITRKLQSGATLSSKLGLDLVKLLTMDKTSTFGIFADATVTIPLLRGAGRDVAREPLTLAERNVIYAIREFERYKKSFAVTVASDFLRTLEQKKQIENARSNFESIASARIRMEALSRAGRTSQTDVDQASQDELKANNSVISAEQSFEEKIDAFKATLGIPVDSVIELEAEDLIVLSKEIIAEIEERQSLSPAELLKVSNSSVKDALSSRLDLMTVRDQHDDLKRQLNVAENDLDADMKLVLNASTRQTSISGGSPEINEETGELISTPQDDELGFGDASYSALLELDLPWDKTEERTAFRKALIALESSERDIEEKEDAVKTEVRSAVRKIAELRETYLIQRQAVTLAQRRVKSTELFMQAGKVEIRDLLEAQEALVEAQDSLVSAVVSYHLASLGLKRDIGLLSVDEKGLWRENENNK